MIQEAERYKDVDSERRELIELRNSAEGLMMTTERSLSEYGDLLSPLDVEDIQQDMAALKESLDSADPDEKLAIANLEQSAIVLRMQCTQTQLRAIPTSPLMMEIR